MLENICELEDKNLELFARRLLPEIKQYFANDEVRKEFLQWKVKKLDIKG